jgi:hypothetical protein
MTHSFDYIKVIYAFVTLLQFGIYLQFKIYVYILQENDGIDTEDSYPYEGKDQSDCRYKAENKGASLTSYVELPANDEENLKNIVGVIGPVAVAIEATHKLQFYHTGVFHDTSCHPNLNHGVSSISLKELVDFHLID